MGKIGGASSVDAIDVSQLVRLHFFFFFNVSFFLIFSDKLIIFPDHTVVFSVLSD